MALLTWLINSFWVDRRLAGFHIIELERLTERIILVE
jgi:hypothetical protein